MNIILLSGGSGKRLWPLSNNVRSKQFIKLFKRADGSYESMVQRVYRQILAADPGASIVVAAPEVQVSVLRNQLGKGLDISVEPCRRDTFPAIALAASYLRDVKGISENESLLVCPVDPYVEEDYFETLKDLEAQANKGEANIVLMGIEPTYPSEKYGYIIPSTKDFVSGVSLFSEKPDVETARRYIERGALWNGGVFAFQLRYILNKAREMIGFTDYADLLSKYETLQSISFDYAVVEKEASIQVVRFAGQWKDLGTWNTLTEAMKETCSENAIMDHTCANVHILNELDVPVLAMGLRDVVISAGPEGILVADKEQSSYLKPFADRFDQEIKYAEKSWGSYRVIDAEAGSLTIKVTLLPGHQMSYHSHNYRDEVWTVIAGEGVATVDGARRTVCPGDIITMRAGCRHTVQAKTELKLIEVQLGRDINVEDKQCYCLE